MGISGNKWAKLIISFTLKIVLHFFFYRTTFKLACMNTHTSVQPIPTQRHAHAFSLITFFPHSAAPCRGYELHEVSQVPPHFPVRAQCLFSIQLLRTQTLVQTLNNWLTYTQKHTHFPHSWLHSP